MAPTVADVMVATLKASGARHIPREEIGLGYFQETHPGRLFVECSVYCELVSIPGQDRGVHQRRAGVRGTGDEVGRDRQLRHRPGQSRLRRDSQGHRAVRRPGRKLKGFTLYATRTILSGGGEQPVEFAKSNLRELEVE